MVVHDRFILFPFYLLLIFHLFFFKRDTHSDSRRCSDIEEPRPAFKARSLYFENEPYVVDGETETLFFSKILRDKLSHNVEKKFFFVTKSQMSLKIEASPLQRPRKIRCTIFPRTVYRILNRIGENEFFDLLLTHMSLIIKVQWNDETKKSYVKFSEFVVKGRLQSSSLS